MFPLQRYYISFDTPKYILVFLWTHCPSEYFVLYLYHKSMSVCRSNSLSYSRPFIVWFGESIVFVS